MIEAFIVARNPERDSSLPYLVHVPLDGGTWFKARETWPRASRVYCHPADEVDVAALDVLERIAVLSCGRRGPVVDLVLDRAQNRRAQFVFTQSRGRPTIFWQTPQAAANARPGLRIPRPAARGLERIVIDTRERYGYFFHGRGVALKRAALRCGDYAAFVDGEAVALVERKAMDDFCGALVDGTLAFVMAELARLQGGAVVVEGSYSKLLRRGFVDGAWLGQLVARLHVRYPTVPIVFVETRALGERWTFEFFAAAAAERDDPAIPLSALVIPPPQRPRGRPKKTAQAGSPAADETAGANVRTR